MPPSYARSITTVCTSQQSDSSRPPNWSISACAVRVASVYLCSSTAVNEALPLSATMAARASHPTAGEAPCAMAKFDDEAPKYREYHDGGVMPRTVATSPTRLPMHAVVDISSSIAA